MERLLDELDGCNPVPPLRSHTPELVPAPDRQPDASNPEAECLMAEVQRLRDDLELATAHGNDLRAQLNRERAVSETLRGELARLRMAVQQAARVHNQ